jgi:hypothetical protein
VQAYSLGFSNVDYVRQDPDLRNVQRANPAYFQQLTSMQLTGPRFIWGMILDDAIVHNDSPFPLTNLAIHVVVHKGGTVYSFNMKCPSVRAGGDCRNDNVVSISGNSYDSLQWAFTSDQGHK